MTARARRLIGCLRELKVQLADEMHGASAAEHDAIQQLFVRLARATTRLADCEDEAAVIQIEVEQARSIAMEQRGLLHRRHLNVATPHWRAPMSRDANLLFYSGPDRGRDILTELAEPLRINLNPPAYAADTAAARWRDLRAAGSCIFDLTRLEPETQYYLGCALTLGTHCVLIADTETQIPFDIGQDVVRYAPSELQDVMAQTLDSALFGIAPSGDPRTSVDAALDYARSLARAHGTPLAMTVFSELAHGQVEAMRAHSLLRLLDPLIPERNVVVLRSRWAASFPTQERRCFVVMPFRRELDATWMTIQRACERAGVSAVRGDHATGQDIISSIWSEIGRSTEVVVDLTGFSANVCIELGMADTLGRPVLVVGRAGTEKQLESRFPALAKRRCHAYTDANELEAPLARLFGGELAWA